MKFRFPQGVFPTLGLILLISGLIASVVAILRSTELRRRATEAENRLVGEWKFDEGVGGTVADSSGNGNNGTWNGTGSHWADGKFAKAGNFNGTDDYIKVSDSTNLHSDNFSITAWFKKNSGTGHILAKEYGPGGDDSYAIWFPQENKIAAHTSDGAGGVEYAQVTDGQWYHVAFAKSGTGTNLFVDGIQVSTANSASLTTKFDDSSLFIGADDNDNNEVGDGLFNGLIDQVRIYNYALTPEQIVADMGQISPTPTPPGPITCRDGFSDNFDGTSLDLSKWSVFSQTTGSTITQSAGTLNINSVHGSFGGNGISSNKILSGDFMTEATINSFQVAADNVGSAELQFDSNNGNGGIYLAWRKVRGNSYVDIASAGGQVIVSSGFDVGNATLVKVRMIRNGSTIKGYVDIGSGFQHIGTLLNAFSGEGKSRLLAVVFNDSNAPISASFDNFSLRCPPPIGDLDGDRDVDIFDYNLLLEKFGERKQLIFQDNFDAPEIDGERWNYNQISQTNGVLVTTVPAESVNTGGFISSKTHLSGNFQIETDMKNFLAKENDPGFATTSELKMWYNDSNAFMLRWVKDGGGSYIDYVNNLDGVWNNGYNNPIPNVSSLRARLIRNGNTMKGFIDVGNGMTEIFSVPNVYTGSGYIQDIFWKALQSFPFEAKAEFDNFSAWSNPPNIGDIDNDGDVDIFDYNLLLENFGN